ncbi:MAG: TetR/AcrR family transcriptional regulator [Planctomycetes bacterium]|nr:TetR/AcrR family transcriptional regulator [Planctomycetota bacterium]
MDWRKTDQAFDSEEPSAPSGRGKFESRRNHILGAATHVFAQVGYEKASMRAIARAADLSLAGLYHYYESKEQILFVMQFRVFSSLLTNLREKLHGIEDPVERLRVMIHEHVSYFAAHMAELKVCSHELDSLGGEAYEETRAIRREYYAVSREIIENVVQLNPPAWPVNLHVATMALFGTLNWLYRWYSPDGDGSSRTVATQITNQFLSGLSPALAAEAAAPAEPGA